jgi:hypothetical protein
MALPPPPNPVPKKRGGKACLGCGCALLIVVALIIIALVYGSYHTALNLTDATPAPIPQVDSGPAVYATAQQKISDFQQAIEHDQPATLPLKSDEINTYIARDPSMAMIRGRVFVKLDGSDATVQASLPLGAFEKAVMTDRYVNCGASLSLAFDPQTKGITVDLQSLNLKGTELPSTSNASFNQAINNAIAQQIQGSAPAKDFLARTQKIAIENGELVIETK